MSEPITIIDRLLSHAEQRPDHCAVATAHMTLSYAALYRAVVAQAVRLNVAGVSGESIVGVCSDNEVQQLIFCLAAAYLGATSCTVPTYEKLPQRQALLRLMGVTHLADESLMAHTVEGGSDQLSPSKAAAGLLFSTSGTTGEPKVVVFSDSDIVLQAPRHIGSENERFACIASMEHNFAKRHRLYCVAQGATNVFIDKTFATVVQQSRSLNVSTLHITAFQAQELLAVVGTEGMPEVRLKLGGSHVPALLRESLRDKITEHVQFGYGTTETGALAFTDPSDKSGGGESVGRPLPGIEILLVDSSRKPQASGEPGEIAVRSTGLFRGYKGQPELTAACLDNGWFYTGDIGQLDEHGRITLHGRSDDMFVFNSINIYPQDIESQIRQFPTVVDAAVLAKPSPVHGDIPVAIVVFESKAEPDVKGLKKRLRSQLGLRCPRQLVAVDEVPRNAAGKIVRAEAQALLIGRREA